MMAVSSTTTPAPTTTTGRGWVARGVSSRIWLPVAGVVLFFLVWQLLSVGPLADSNLPYASGTFLVLADLVQTAGFWSSVGETLTQAGIGYALAVGIGVPLGIAVGLSVVVHRSTRILVEVLKPIPSVVILPLVVLQLGLSRSMAVFLVVFTLVPLLIVTVASGARDTDPLLLDAGRSYRLGRWARTRFIVLPSSLPFIATGLRIGASFALIIAVVAEVIGGAPGLGRDLDASRQAGLLETVFAYVIVLGLLGVVVNLLLTRFERRLIHWHESVRNYGGGQDGGRASRRVRAPARTGAVAPASGRLADAVETVETRLRRLRPARSSAGRSARRSPNRRVPSWALRVLEIGVPVGLLVWWWFGSADSVDPFNPSAATIWRRFQEIWVFEQVPRDVVPSLRNLVLGLGIAIVVGVGAGVVIAQVRWLQAMLDPLISFLRSVPGIAYLPLLVAVVGFNSEMRVTAIALAALFPTLIATIDGMKGVDETLLAVGRSYRLSGMRRLVSIQLPAASPRIFAGLEISLAAALIVMVASELLGTSEGIGAQVLLAQQTFQFADMWAGIVLLAVLGVLTNIIFRLVRGRVLAWYDGLRAAARAQ